MGAKFWSFDLFCREENRFIHDDVGNDDVALVSPLLLLLLLIDAILAYCCLLVFERLTTAAKKVCSPLLLL